ncbi:hypothetical protein HHK36_028455 [Tetracentron sinense]|uniref:E3 ubiquitin-protein ligase n=1 Tax=Tetracentron sinense TaxID=13715 RepID=A0A834YB32_TETSI|nr:hypothetical protein HHK36_028455 [Tetracentron sinense]
MDMPFDLGHYIASIHSLLVARAFSVDGAEEAKDDTLFNTDKEYLDDSDCLRHTKVGRLSQESSVCSTLGRSSTPDFVSKADDINSDTCGRISIPFSVILLTFECLRVIEHWLGLDATSGAPLNSSSPDTSSNFGTNFLSLKKTLSKIMKGKNSSKLYMVPLTRSGLTTSSRLHGRNISSPVNTGFRMSVDLENGQGIVQDNNSMVTSEMGHEHASTSCGFDDSIVEANCATELEALRVLGLSDWLDIVYDVLKGCHPYGFSAFVMEHPLRIRVFCAQVSELSLELDLFLLQCCAAFAPPDLCDKRILERFVLSNYLSLNIEQSSEYVPYLPDLLLKALIVFVAGFIDASTRKFLNASECDMLPFREEFLSKYEPVLVQEMLTLIIQIVKERRFCGLSTTDSLRRELDLYHPCYSRDLQVVEERYLRFCEVSALTVQLPRWTKHLLSLALDIYFLQKQSGDRTCMSTSCYNDDPLHSLAFVGEEIDVGATDRSDAWEGQSMLSLLVSLMRTHKKDLSNFIEAGNCNMASLIEDLLKKFAELDAGCMTKMQRLANEEVCFQDFRINDPPILDAFVDDLGVDVPHKSRSEMSDPTPDVVGSAATNDDDSAGEESVDTDLEGKVDEIGSKGLDEDEDSDVDASSAHPGESPLL